MPGALVPTSGRRAGSKVCDPCDFIEADIRRGESVLRARIAVNLVLMVPPVSPNVMLLAVSGEAVFPLSHGERRSSVA
jgi:hypothetical protein